MTSKPPIDARFYSQHGEDVLLWKALGDSAGPRYFVEVGVVDGIRFSNTFALEQRGWRGLCVEAHPDYVDLVRRNRPGSTVIHAAASDESGVVPFYADPRGDLSSLVQRDEQEMKRRFGRWFQGLRPVDVQARTLDDMLGEAGAPRGFEVLSIDIEGAEPAALRGLDLRRWRPRVVLLEADGDDARAQLDRHMLPRGYHFARMIGINATYTSTRADAWRMRLARVDRHVFHPAHPKDPSTRDMLVLPYAYEKRGRYARRILRTLARAA